MKLTIIGPNLLDQSKGEIHVHAAGCADLDRGEYPRRKDCTYHEEHDSVRSVVETFYADQLAEEPDASWEAYSGSFWFAPCASEKLPWTPGPQHPNGTFTLGTRVAFTPDPRVRGIVVGHGVVYAEIDPHNTTNEAYNVVLVSLDLDAQTQLAGGGRMGTVQPFVANVLTAI